LWTILSSFPRGHWSHEGGWENSTHERDIERKGCEILTREDYSTPRVIPAGHDKDVVLMTEESRGEILNQGARFVRHATSADELADISPCF
jgi:hypothetical protein